MFEHLGSFGFEVSPMPRTNKQTDKRTFYLSRPAESAWVIKELIVLEIKIAEKLLVCTFHTCVDNTLDVVPAYQEM